jgi:MIP family channel proteins
MAEADMMVPAEDMHAESFIPNDILDDWIRPLVAEMIGPFALVFIGAGSIMTAAANGFGDGGTLVLVALAHGLALGLMIAATGHISGGHFNPAVTIGLFIGGKIGAIKGIAYIIAQLVGAALAALALRYIFPEAIREGTNFAIPTVAYEGDLSNMIVGREHALVLEMITTFFLVYVVCGTAVDSRGPHAIASLCIGLMVTADILLAGPLTGAAMNPARHFGPALVEGEWKDTWIYWVGPVVGGIIASVVHNYILIPKSVGFPEPKPTEHHA